MFIAAVFATLTACTKEAPESGAGDNGSSESGTSFKKGENVTISVDSPQTKISSSALGSDGTISFKWDDSDAIKVTVGGESATFTLKSGSGSGSATFEGKMPGSGDTFDVQYPVDGVEESALNSQTYSSSEAIEKGKMLFKKTGCEKGKAITLEPQFAVLRLNLYGLDRKVKGIDVYYGSRASIYTLSISEAVTVGRTADTATPFLIVLPPEQNKHLYVFVTTETITPAQETITYPEGGNAVIIKNEYLKTTSKKTLTAGQILNMAAQPLTFVWAPVNCGYDAANHPYGLLYQFGRKYGQAYDGEADKVPAEGDFVTTENPLTEYPDGADYNIKFYKNEDQEYWYNGSNPAYLDLWNGDDKHNPCPSGWRVPTYPEFSQSVDSSPEAGHSNKWVSGRKIDGTEGGTYCGMLIDDNLFFLVCGYRMSSGDCKRRTGESVEGRYWLFGAPDANIKHGGSYYLYSEQGGEDGDGNLKSIERGRGNAVRCIRK